MTNSAPAVLEVIRPNRSQVFTMLTVLTMILYLPIVRRQHDYAERFQ